MFDFSANTRRKKVLKNYRLKRVITVYYCLLLFTILYCLINWPSNVGNLHTIVIFFIVFLFKNFRFPPDYYAVNINFVIWSTFVMLQKVDHFFLDWMNMRPLPSWKTRVLILSMDKCSWHLCLLVRSLLHTLYYKRKKRSTRGKCLWVVYPRILTKVNKWRFLLICAKDFFFFFYLYL